jgi:6-phosphogluconolactonase
MRFKILSIFLFIAIASFGQSKEYYLLVGTYTKPKGNGEGIYIYRFNTTTGSATFVNKTTTENPSYLTFSNDEKFVYSVNQNGDNQPNEASAFLFDAKEGKLSFINKQNVNANGPCYITADKQNKWIFTANYFAGSISCLPINKDGSLAPLQQLIQHTGGSIVKGRQESAHAHTVVFTQDEKYLAATDLGTDKISFYAFNSNHSSTPLTIDSTKDIIAIPGSGPRHLAFSKNNKILYAINELSGNISVYQNNKESKTLIQTISTDTTNNKDKGSGDIHISNDGKFLYATNRGKYNNISIYSIQSSGKLSFIGLQPTLGKTPRNFIIDPTDNFLLVANQSSDNIFVFKRDKQTGLLNYTNIEIKVGTPVCLKMVVIK